MKDNLAIFWEKFSETNYSEVEIFSPCGIHCYFWADDERDFSVGWDDDPNDTKTAHVFHGYASAEEALSAKVLPDGQCLNDIIRKTDIKDISIM
ncbi:MAG: hypothetical protein Q4D98_11885 [Planctomycetia bacterium]|nr:hypothetical protein [Planctomycetia bacterium]